MAIVQPVNNKTNTIEVSNEATDLLSGAPIAFGALTTPLPGFPAIVRGVTAGAFVGKFRLGDVIYARDTGRLWLYLADNLGAPVLVLITEGSINGNAVGQGPDIVLVVADKAGKYAPFSMSSAVYQDIPSAVAAVPNSGATILLLDDTYTLAATVAIGAGVQAISFASLGASGSSGQTPTVGVIGPAGAPMFSSAAAALQLHINGVGFFPALGQQTFAPSGILSVIATNATVGRLDYATNGGEAAAIRLDNSFLEELTFNPALNASVRAVNSSVISTMTHAAGVGTATVVMKDSFVGAITGNGRIDLDMTSGQVDGNLVSLASMTMRGTFLSGALSLSTTGAMSFESVRAAAVLAVNAGSSLTCRNCSLTGANSYTATTTYTQEGGAVLGTINVGTNSIVRNGQAGSLVVTGTSTSAQAIVSDITAAGVDDDHSVVAGSITIGGTISTLNGTSAGGVVSKSAGLLTATDVNVEVTGLGAGLGAMQIAAGATLILRGDCYVEGVNVAGPNTAVSGAGNVEIAGNLGGGCFLANTLTISTTRSFGLAHRTVDVALAANTTMLTAGGNNVADAFRVVPTASGFNFELYDPSLFAVGFEVAVKNVDYVGAFGFNVVPAAGDTLDNLATGITLGQNNVARFRVVSASAWETF